MSIFLAAILAISANPSEPHRQPPRRRGSGRRAGSPAQRPRVGRRCPCRLAALGQSHRPGGRRRRARLLGIYREFLQDTRLARSQRETLRLTVRARLDQLCTQISKRIAKEKAAAKPNAAVKSVAAARSAGGEALAQVGLPPGGGRAAAPRGQNANADNGQQLGRPDPDRHLSEELGRQRRRLHDLLLATATCDRRSRHR